MKWLIGMMALLAAAPVHAAQLEVRGNRITYSGQEIWLQGVAVGDAVLTRASRPLEDYGVIAQEWNANTVRISIHPGVWRDYGRKASLDALKRETYAALNAGMFVIIAWHVIGAPDGYYQKAPEGLAADIYDSDFTLAQDFWRQVAGTFGRDGRVVFELWNEPVYSDEPRSQEPRWKELRPYWIDLIQTVRNVGARNLLLVTSNGWGHNLRGVKEAPIRDGNLAYAWHVYSGTEGSNPHGWTLNLDRLDFSHPVVVTEWGFDPKEQATSGEDALNFGRPFAEQFLLPKPLHHTAWAWHTEWTPRLLESDWRTPTQYGAFVKDVLWQRPPAALRRP